MNAPMIPVAWGEVFDKHTILVTKRLHISDPAKLANIITETRGIESVLNTIDFTEDMGKAYKELLLINGALWQIENGKRQCEKEQRFDAHFINLARQVYILNDQRAAIKRQINVLLKSDIVEEKQHL